MRAARRMRRWYRYAVWRGLTAVRRAGRAAALADTRAARLASDAPRPRQPCSVDTISRRWPRDRPPERSTMRTVFAADWLQVGPLALFEICADAFLKQMVRAHRRQSAVGRTADTGHLTTSAPRCDARDRRAGGPNAPAVGLTLTRIEY